MVWESETPAFSLGLGAARESRRGARQERAEEEHGSFLSPVFSEATLCFPLLFIFVCFSKVSPDIHLHNNTVR